MARLTGDIKIEGTIGDFTFYRMEDRYLVRQKAGVDRKRYLKDPAFHRSRKCSDAFGQASKAARVFRTAFSSLVEDFPCRRLNSGVTGVMVKVISDGNGSGDKANNMNAGNLRLMEGFEFNKKALLGEIFQISYQTAIHRGTGEARILIPGFIPTDSLMNRANATHFRFHAALAAIDFKAGLHQLVRAETDQILFGSQQEQALKLSMILPGREVCDLPFFLVLGVEFSRKVLQRFFRVDGGIHNALRIIRVDVAVTDSGSEGKV